MSSTDDPRNRKPERPGRLSSRARLIQRLPPVEDPTEVWRPISGFVGIYEISNQGRLRGLGRSVDAQSPKGKTYERELDEIELTATPDRNGRLMVCLCRDGKRVYAGVASLVLISFDQAKPSGHVVAHADGDKGNCALENLSWRPRGSTRARPA